jgi:hypothetical protein
VTTYLPDILCLAGVATLGVGLWWLSPAVALIVVGAVVAGAGLLLGREVLPRRRRQPGRNP